jgi:hypothetical protein
LAHAPVLRAHIVVVTVLVQRAAAAVRVPQIDEAVAVVVLQVVANSLVPTGWLGIVRARLHAVAARVVRALVAVIAASRADDAGFAFAVEVGQEQAVAPRIAAPVADFLLGELAFLSDAHTGPTKVQQGSAVRVDPALDARVTVGVTEWSCLGAVGVGAARLAQTTTTAAAGTDRVGTADTIPTAARRHDAS